MWLPIVIGANLAIASTKVHSFNIKVGSMETKVAKRAFEDGERRHREKEKKTRSEPWGNNLLELLIKHLCFLIKLI